MWSPNTRTTAKQLFNIHMYFQSLIVYFKYLPLIERQVVCTFVGNNTPLIERHVVCTFVVNNTPLIERQLVCTFVDHVI